MRDGEPSSFSVAAPARQARQLLASALELLQRDRSPSPKASEALVHAASASSSLYRVEAEARTFEAATAGIHIASGRLRQALAAVSLSRAAEPNHELAAAAMQRSLALLDPITEATQRKRRAAVVERELSDADREALRGGHPPLPTRPAASGIPLEGERRLNLPRTSFEIDIGLYSEAKFQSALSLDISSGGVFVSTHHPLAQGSKVTLHFLLPSGHAVEARGEVCWARSAGGAEPPGMGVRFLSLSPEDMSEIRRASEEIPPSRHG